MTDNGNHRIPILQVLTKQQQEKIDEISKQLKEILDTTARVDERSSINQQLIIGLFLFLSGQLVLLSLKFLGW